MDRNNFTVLKEAVRSDLRGRLVLGDPYKDRQFSIYLGPAGELLLIPVVTIPEREAWLFKSTAAKKAIEKGLMESSEGKTKSIGSFAKYADIEVKE